MDALMENMERLSCILNVLQYETYFSFHDLYMLSLTCKQFHAVCVEMESAFTNRMTNCNASKTHMSFMVNQKQRQITVQHQEQTSLLVKRMQFSEGRNKHLNSYSLFYTGVNPTKKKLMRKLEGVLPCIQGNELKVSIPAGKKEDLFHYIRLQRKKIAPRLTERLFLKVYNNVIKFSLNGQPVSKSLHNKRIRK